MAQLEIRYLFLQQPHNIPVHAVQDLYDGILSSIEAVMKIKDIPAHCSVLASLIIKLLHNIQLHNKGINKGILVPCLGSHPRAAHGATAHTGLGNQWPSRRGAGRVWVCLGSSYAVGTGTQTSHRLPPLDWNHLSFQSGGKVERQVRMEGLKEERNKQRHAKKSYFNSQCCPLEVKYLKAHSEIQLQMQWNNPQYNECTSFNLNRVHLWSPFHTISAL